MLHSVRDPSSLSPLTCPSVRFAYQRIASLIANTALLLFVVETNVCVQNRPDTKKKTRMTFLALAFAAILVREMHIIAYGEYYVNTVVNNGQRHPRMSLALNFASHGLFAIFIADFIYFYSPVVKKGLKLPSKCNHKLCVHHARRFTIFLLGLAILLPWFLFVASWIALDEYDVVGKDQNEKWARGLLAFSKFALAWAVHNWIAHAHAEDQQVSASMMFAQCHRLTTPVQIKPYLAGLAHERSDHLCHGGHAHSVHRVLC